MNRTLLLCALLASCAAPTTTREICGTNPDGWQWCVTIQERRP